MPPPVDLSVGTPLLLRHEDVTEISTALACLHRSLKLGDVSCDKNIPLCGVTPRSDLTSHYLLANKLGMEDWANQELDDFCVHLRTGAGPALTKPYLEKPGLPEDCPLKRLLLEQLA